MVILIVLIMAAKTINNSYYKQGNMKSKKCCYTYFLNMENIYLFINDVIISQVLWNIIWNLEDNVKNKYFYPKYNSTLHF